MNVPTNFALNHMVAPSRDVRDFFGLARRLGITDVEIRNDLAGQAIANQTPAGDIRAEAAAAGVVIISINALQRFNAWTPSRAEEARALAAYATACGAKALVLCPVNDEAAAPPEAQRLAMLREALCGLRPILEEAGIVGLVEPLGFAESSLRLKREAVDAIQAVQATGTFRLVHDTFHHFVAGETELFPGSTGLVHCSGVTDPSLGAARMRDSHRVLVTRADLIDNVGQIAALRRGGYDGLVSFEPFAPGVHDSLDIEAELRASLTLIDNGLRTAAA